MDDKKTPKISHLKNLIKKWDDEYYIHGTPSVSDAEYDRVFEELRALDPQAISIGSDLSPSNSLKEAPHLVPLLSLDKVYAIQDLDKWLSKIPTTQFSIEPKIDGVSLALTYRNGKFEQALTRGDGYKGLDVTHNVRYIPDIPHMLTSQETYVFRGEIFITHRDFERQKEHSIYANPRNLASGMLRRLDLSPQEASFLHLYIYEGHRFPTDFSSNEEMWEFLANNHFPLAPHTHFFDKSAPLEPLIKELQDSRKTLPFDIDGLVIKVNDKTIQKFLGETHHHPKWAMALKFSPPTSLSEILGISTQVGRTGKITPLAHLQPVLIQGSTVKKATLHNKAMVEALEIGIGDIVSISKRGDIIPAIEEIVEKKGAIWQFPTLCPSCQTPLLSQGPNEFCPFTECPDKIRAQLLYFTKTLEMEGFGESLITLLYHEKNLRKPENFWEIDMDSLSFFEGFGMKKIQNLKNILNKIPKITPFRTLMVAIGIPEIGQNIMTLLAHQGYFSLESLLSLSENQTLSIRGIGEKTAQRLHEALSSSSHWVQSLRKLEKYGFSLSENEEFSKILGPLSGSVWVLTGTFQHFNPREKAATIIRNLGGTVASSVTQHTTHLLYGEQAGKKLQKAGENSRISLVSEEEFIQEYGP